MVSKLSATSVDRIAAWSAATAARCASTWAITESTALCAMKFCARRSCARVSWRFKSASVAWSRNSCARARSRSARCARSSSRNSTSPRRTN
jgi:hypothetical protein